MIVSAPSRLHFGLFHVPVPDLNYWPDGSPIRRFGGLGMMVRDPGIRVVATQADTFSASGSLGERALHYATRIPNAPPAALHADGPPEHSGLGVGTALAMATARAILGVPIDDAIPRLLGRGNRSGIGLHGFREGGFIVDDGKLADELPSIHERIDVPIHWRVVMIRPSVSAPWHGDAERSAFRRPRPEDESLNRTDRLLRLAKDQIVPALKRHDFNAFAGNLTEFNRIAGEPFAADQGGAFSDPTVTRIVEELQSWGIRGAGQSSWGPTVFAFASGESEAVELRDRLDRRFPDLAELRITAADNVGAQISSDQ